MSETVKGLKKLIETLRQFPEELSEKVDRQVEISAQDIVGEAKRECPYDTGTLRRSIGSEKVDERSYVVRTNTTGLAPYGPYVEYGTRYQRAQPFFSPAVVNGRKRFQSDLEDLLDKEVKKI